jgi:hypothetical protein
MLKIMGWHGTAVLASVIAVLYFFRALLRPEPLHVAAVQAVVFSILLTAGLALAVSACERIFR